MLKIKLFAALAVLAFAAGAFLFSGSKTGAQEKPGTRDAKRDAVLDRIASYKLWQEVRKPEKKNAAPEVIINSTAMG